MPDTVSLLVDSIPTPSASEFYQRYLLPSRPVVLRGFLTTWPAFKCWSPTVFADRFADKMVETMVDLRNNRPDDPTPYRKRLSMTMMEFVDRLQAEPTPDDIYLVAHNALLQDSVFSSLWSEIELDPAWFDIKSSSSGVSLWFGPRSSTTPLHYDLVNTILAQVYGRKRVILGDPSQTPWLYNLHGTYAMVDPERPNLNNYPLFEKAKLQGVTIKTGDALYIPARWWHHVVSLSTSMSLSLRNLAWGI